MIELPNNGCRVRIQECDPHRRTLTEPRASPVWELSSQRSTQLTNRSPKQSFHPFPAMNSLKSCIVWAARLWRSLHSPEYQPKSRYSHAVWYPRGPLRWGQWWYKAFPPWPWYQWSTSLMGRWHAPLRRKHWHWCRRPSCRANGTCHGDACLLPLLQGSSSLEVSSLKYRKSRARDLRKKLRSASQDVPKISIDILYHIVF